MAAFAGRDLRIKYDADGAGGNASVAIAGAKSGSFTIAVEGIDITDKDDSGVRTMLDDIGTKSLDFTVEGVLKSSILLELVNDSGKGTAIHTFEILVGGLGTFVVPTLITQFESSGQDGAEATTFTASMQSAGAWTWTAAI